MRSVPWPGRRLGHPTGQARLAGRVCIGPSRNLKRGEGGEREGEREEGREGGREKGMKGGMKGGRERDRQARRH